MKEMISYWEKAIDFEEYLNVAEQRLNNPQTPEDVEKREYYDLGIQRMNRALKTFKKEESQLEKLKKLDFKGKVLLITEPWCGDASATVPSVVKFFEDTNEVRIFLRDEDTSLIDQYLTNGTQSIPIVLLLNEKFEVINHWGPRPAYGTELLMKFKENPEVYTREMFYNDLQVYYAKNKGQDAIEEILELLS